MSVYLNNFDPILLRFVYTRAADLALFEHAGCSNVSYYLVGSLMSMHGTVFVEQRSSRKGITRWIVVYLCGCSCIHLLALPQLSLSRQPRCSVCMWVEIVHAAMLGGSGAAHYGVRYCFRLCILGRQKDPKCVRTGSLA